MANESQNLPIKTKKIQIHGFTKTQREISLQKVKLKYESQGWVLAKYEDSGGVKGFLDTYVEFHRLSLPTGRQKLFDWYEENRIKILGWSFGVLILVLFYGCYQVGQKENDKRAFENTQRELEFQKIKKQKIQTANEVAISLKNFFRNNGINESLVIDVKVDEFSNLVIVVSNSWLASPSYEQKQMRQIIELTLKKIIKPDGWPYYLTDFLGNRI